MVTDFEVLSLDILLFILDSIYIFQYLGGVLQGFFLQTRLMGSADDKMEKIRGHTRWIFVIMDSTTRFVLSVKISLNKKEYNATKLLQNAKERVGFVPQMFVTDGLQSFHNAFKIVYYMPKMISLHIREIHLQNQYCQNNMHERFNGELSDRLKTSRGLKSEEPVLLRILILHHNYIRPHMGLQGQTPAKVAGIHIQGTSAYG